MTELVNVGTAKIRSQLVWNRTGIVLARDQRYLLTAQGTWVDFFLKHGPAGDPSRSMYMRLFDRYRRLPEANWFALIGAIDSDLTTAFVIGRANEFTARIAGELTCFANDVRCMYWNNCGHVELDVKRYV